MAWHKKRVQVSTQVGWGGGPQCTDNDHGTNTNYEDMLSVCKCPSWSPNTIKCSQATQRKSMGDGDRSEKREEWELTGTAIGRHQLGTIKDIGALFGPGSTAVPVLPSQGAISLRCSQCCYRQPCHPPWSSHSALVPLKTPAPVVLSF